MPKLNKTFRASEQAWAQFKKYQELHKFKTETETVEDILLHLNQPQPITSDVPLGEPQNPEKEKAIQELKQEAIEPLPPPQCNFVGYGKGYIDKKTGVQMVFCDNPRKYKEPEAVPLSSCISCWKRKEWGKEKREQEQENKPEPEPLEGQAEPLNPLNFRYPNDKEARLLYHCHLKDESYHFLELPCIRDWNANNGQILCTREECVAKVMDKINNW